MFKRTATITFFLGIAVGILGVLLLPKYIHLPEFLTGKGSVINGTIIAKQQDKNVLLMTVNTPQGALLATFHRKADEVNLLTTETDQIELRVPRYTPFVDDPKITRVTKASPAPGSAPIVRRPAVLPKGAGKSTPETPEKTPQKTGEVGLKDKTGSSIKPDSGSPSLDEKKPAQ